MASEQASRRNAPVAVTILLVILGIVFVVIAAVYFAKTATNLPSFFPGHQTGSTKHHTKHGLLAAGLGVLCFIGAWFSSGSKSATTATE